MRGESTVGREPHPTEIMEDTIERNL